MNPAPSLLPMAISSCARDLLAMVSTNASVVAGRRGFCSGANSAQPSFFLQHSVQSCESKEKRVQENFQKAKWANQESKRERQDQVTARSHTAVIVTALIKWEALNGPWVFPRASMTNPRGTSSIRLGIDRVLFVLLLLQDPSGGHAVIKHESSQSFSPTSCVRHPWTPKTTPLPCGLPTFRGQVPTFRVRTFLGLACTMSCWSARVGPAVKPTLVAVASLSAVSES